MKIGEASDGGVKISITPEQCDTVEWSVKF